MNLVMLMRLDSSQGFFEMSDAMRVAGELQKHGVDAVAEAAPAADGVHGVHVFYIKVPEDQLEKAKTIKLDV